MKNNAFLIGNGGYGDMIACIGIVNFLSSKYQNVFVACMKKNMIQAKTFYYRENIKLYPIDQDNQTTMCHFDLMMRNSPQFDVYAVGHYGAKKIDYDKYYKIDNNGKQKPIIYEYPISYYDDIQMPIKYMTEYFEVIYPKEIEEIYNELLKNYPEYIVVHQIGTSLLVNLIKMNNIDINKTLVIDVNKNLYDKNHKFYGIANKFINFPSILHYSKLLTNARELYLIDSCIHVLALIQDLSTVKIKKCYQREYRLKYGFDKFEYYLIAGNTVVKTKLPLDVTRINNDYVVKDGDIKVIHQYVEMTNLE